MWNQTRKRDNWGRKHQQPREAGEWIRRDRPDLRIVPDELWQAAHARLAGAREDYVRRNTGRAWGRPTNGTESKYLLTGLAQCGWCNGGLFVHSREHGSRRAYFYACTSYHLRGRKVCENRQLLPMELTNVGVLETFRADLVDPRVIERALSKFEARHTAQPDTTRAGALEAEQHQLQLELSRLTAALAAGGSLDSILSAVRDREARLNTIAAELGRQRTEVAALDVSLEVVMP